MRGTMEEIPFPFIFLRQTKSLYSLEQHLPLLVCSKCRKIYFFFKKQSKNPIERLSDRYFKTIRYPSCNCNHLLLYIEKYLYLLLIS
jgi:hypothetical protein